MIFLYLTVTLILILFIFLFLVILPSRVWYPAALIYNYVCDHTLYKYYQEARKQLNSGEHFAMYPLSYFCTSGQDIYFDKHPDEYYFIIFKDEPVLYKGSKICITQFSKPLIDELIRVGGYPKEAIRKLQIMESDAAEMGFGRFVRYYVGEDYDKLTLHEFVNRYAEKKNKDLKDNK